MSEEELILLQTLIGIGGGLGFLIFVMHNIFSLIRSAIERKKSSASNGIDPQFFRALSDFKKTTELRLNNIETIITKNDESLTWIDNNTINSGSIEIEEEAVSGTQEKKQNGDLRNMLNE